jgi:hypothetical protein
VKAGHHRNIQVGDEINNPIRKSLHHEAANFTLNGLILKGILSNGPHNTINFCDEIVGRQ